MYTRAYPPKDTPVPEGYSGVALWQRAEEEDAPAPQEEEAAEEAVAEVEQDSAAEDACATEPPVKREGEAFAPNADILLLLLAALLLQGERPENELAMLLLLLLLWES